MTSRYGFMIPIIPPGLHFSFAIAFMFSLQTQRMVCKCCARRTGYFLVGLCPWRVWFTVVCWKVLASKDGVFTRKTKKIRTFLFIYIYIVWRWWSFQFLSCLTLKQSLFFKKKNSHLFFYVQSFLAFPNTLKESSLDSKTERISNSLSSAGPEVHQFLQRAKPPAELSRWEFQPHIEAAWRCPRAL